VEIVQPTNSWIKNAQRTAEAEAEAATASYKFNPKNKNYRFPVDASEFYFSNIAQSLTYRIAKGFFQTPNTKLEYKLDFPEPRWDHYFYKITEKKGKKEETGYWKLRVTSPKTVAATEFEGSSLQVIHGTMTKRGCMEERKGLEWCKSLHYVGR
jgi:hypothetical protein